MSGEGFTYETAIKDGMSGPAQAETSALERLTNALEKNALALEKHGEAHEKAGKHEKEHESIWKQFTSSLIPEIAVGELAAEGIKKIGESVLDLGKELVEASYEAAEFKENAVEAFEVVAEAKEHLFGPSQGEETYDEIEKIAVAGHIGIAKAVGLAKELALVGIENEGIIEQTVAAQGALQRVGLEAGAEKLKKIVEQSEAVGHFVLPKKLAGLGVSGDEIAERLGLPKGSDLKKLKIDTNAGIKALNDVILSGHIGQLAAKKFDLTDVATDWHNVWQKLTEDVDAGPLTSALRGFVQIFDDGSASGRGFKDEIVHDVNTVIAILGDVVDHATNLSLKLELGFLIGRNAAKPLLDRIHQLNGESAAFDSLGASAIQIGTGLTEAAIAAAWLYAEFHALFGGKTNLEKQAAEGGKETGLGWVNGILDAITWGYLTVPKAAEALIERTIFAGKEAGGIHSPSTITYEMGINLGRGLELGIGDSNDRVARAMGDLTMPETSAPTSASGGGGGGSRIVTVEAGAVVNNFHGVSRADEDEIRAIVEDSFADVVDRINLELGG